METVLWWIAGITTGFFALRVILMFIGIDGLGEAGDAADALDAVDAVDGIDAIEAAHAAADASDFKLFSLLSVLSMLMFGSWTALLMHSDGQSETLSLGVGAAAGLVAGVVVAWVMMQIRGLEHDGTLRNFEAKGLKGTCYVKIPEAGQGKGQVQLTVQGRLRTFDAVSDGPEIESFKPVVVMARVDDKTMRVCQTD
ncbi:MAG: hypothetical protein ACYTDT_13140 [Planctomycetota bacterium]|jgi:hypothetical protein